MELKETHFITRSSTKVEYRTLTNAASETIWILLWFKNYKLGTTHLSFNPVQHSRMKHIQIDIHFVCDLVQKGKLSVRHVHTQDQLADLLTKPLSQQRTQYLRNKIGLADGSPFLQGRIKGNTENDTLLSKEKNNSQTCKSNNNLNA